MPKKLRLGHRSPVGAVPPLRSITNTARRPHAGAEQRKASKKLQIRMKSAPARGASLPPSHPPGTDTKSRLLPSPRALTQSIVRHLSAFRRRRYRHLFLEQVRHRPPRPPAPPCPCSPIPPLPPKSRHGEHHSRLPTNSAPAASR